MISKDEKEIIENCLININILSKALNNILTKYNDSIKKESRKSLITFSMFKKCFPNLKDFSYEETYEAFIENYDNPDNGFFEGNSFLRLTYFLAQIGHESGGLRYFEEIADGSAYEGRKDLGNIKKGDGTFFKGRSPIQLTGRANYEAFKKHTNYDVVSNPFILKDNVRVAMLCSFWFWKKNKLHRFADAQDFKGLTKAINGGFNHLQERINYLIKVTTILKEEAD